MRMPQSLQHLLRKNLSTAVAAWRPDHSPARQRPPQIRCHAAMPGMRPHTCRCTPSAFCSASALSLKVSDEFTVPVCRFHHRELHRHGNEAAWWQSIKIEPLPVTYRLWQHSRLNGTAEASVTTTLADCRGLNLHQCRGRQQPMTSFRQIEADRRNAARSTGPNTEEGKHRSRRNAVRHGLSAETVVEIVEDIDNYRGFKAAIIADYDARTAVERELILRLASLLWRLRRATSIEPIR